MKRQIVLFLLWSVVFCSYSFALDPNNDWFSEDKQLNIDGYDPEICSDGIGNIYTTWSLNGNIYFNYSNDGGQTWQSNIRIDNDTTNNTAKYPLIGCQKNGDVYILWEDWRDYDENGISIYFNYSTDFGITWQNNDIKVNSNEADIPFANIPYFKFISDENRNVYVVWGDRRDDNSDIYFNYSNDGGQTWQSSDIKIDGANGMARGKFDVCSNSKTGNIYFTWEDSKEGNVNTFFRHGNINDDVFNWQGDDFKINDYGNSYHPILDCDTNGVYIVWSYSGTYTKNIYFNSAKLNNSNQLIWESDIILNTSPDEAN